MPLSTSDKRRRIELERWWQGRGLLNQIILLTRPRMGLGLMKERTVRRQLGYQAIAVVYHINVTLLPWGEVGRRMKFAKSGGDEFRRRARRAKIEDRCHRTDMEKMQ
jgi:hypothetical protein